MSNENGGILARLEFRLLGVTDVVVDGASAVPTSARQRDLLVLLLLHANQAVPTERLVDRLWRGEPPATAVSALQVYIAKLRALIGGSDGAEIVTVPGGYRLDVDEQSVDMLRFQRLATVGRRALRNGSYRTAAGTLKEALALWRGPAFDDVRHLEGVLVEVTRLDELHAEAVGDLIDAELALGHHNEVMAQLEALVEDDPLRERHWAQLMLALYRCGRQADALRAYQRAAKVLGEELGIEPGPDLYRLEERILLHDPSLTLAAGTDESLTNLEQPATTLVGRATELERLVELTKARPLITLTGPGGVGKTRLAVEAGRRALASFPDGVWFVDLAPIRDPAQLDETVAEALGVVVGADSPTVDQIANHCRHRRLLLILDNCEHLLEPAARLVQALLEPDSPLRVLATSRERLGLDGETTWTVPPLTFPAHDDAEICPGDHEAVDLFVDRAAHVDPSFDLNPDNAASMARICRKLDGLPLAIELAAAWVDVLSVTEIEERLGQTLEALELRARFQPIRHATLWEAMRWSYDLLDEDERGLLQRLAVFVGRFLLEDAEEVCTTEAISRERVFGLLARLVQKSLVVPHVSEGGATRYSLLETVRSFAGSMAKESGIAEESSRRHAERFLALALEAKGELQGPRQRTWLDRLELDLGNIRAALDWLASHGRLEDALRLAAALLWLWKMHDHAKEGAALLTGMLHREEQVALRVRAEALTAAAMLTSTEDVDAAYGMLTEARDVAAKAGDDVAESTALGWMGLFDRIRGDLEASRQHLETALGRAERSGDQRTASLVLGHLAVLARELGSYSEAISHHQRAIQIDQTLGNRQGEAWNTAGIGIVHLYQGDFDEAHSALTRSEAVHEELGFGFELVTVWILLAISEANLGQPDKATIHLARAQQRAVLLDSPRLLDAVYRAQAVVAAARGDDMRAVQMLGVADRIATDHGLGRAMFQAFFDEQERRLRDVLGEAFKSAWESGQVGSLPVTTAP